MCDSEKGRKPVEYVMFSPQREKERENTAGPIQATAAPARCSGLPCWLWRPEGCWGRWHSEPCSDRGAPQDEQTRLKEKKKGVAVSARSPNEGSEEDNVDLLITACQSVQAGCGSRRRPRQSLWFIATISHVIILLSHAQRSCWWHVYVNYELLK